MINQLQHCPLYVCFAPNQFQNTLIYLNIIERFLDSDSFLIPLVNVQSNYCNTNLLILDVKELNKIMKLYYVYTLKALWDSKGKIRMYYGMSRVKKQQGKKSGKRSIAIMRSASCYISYLLEYSLMLSNSRILKGILQTNTKISVQISI